MSKHNREKRLRELVDVRTAEVAVFPGAQHLSREEVESFCGTMIPHYNKMHAGSAMYHTNVCRYTSPTVGEILIAVGGKDRALRVFLFTRADLPEIRELDEDLYRQVEEYLAEQTGGGTN